MNATSFANELKKILKYQDQKWKVDVLDPEVLLTPKNTLIMYQFEIYPAKGYFDLNFLPILNPPKNLFKCEFEKYNHDDCIDKINMSLVLIRDWLEKLTENCNKMIIE